MTTKDSSQRRTAIMEAFVNLTARWDLSDWEAAALLDVSEQTFAIWASEASFMEVNEATYTRLNYLLGIAEALKARDPDDKAAAAWLRERNDAATFKGRSPLALMMDGGLTGLYLTHRHVEAWRV